MAVRFSPPETSDNKPQDPKEVEDLKFEGWFDGAATLPNVTQEISSVVITEKVVMSMRMVEEMEVDEEAEEVDVQLVEGYYDVHSPEADNQIVVEEHILMEPAQPFPELPPSSTPLALPAPSVSTSSSSKCTQLVPFAGNGMVVPSTSSDPPVSVPPMPTVSVPPLAITAAMVAAADSTTTGPDDDGGYNMALVPTAEGPTTLRPKCMKLKQVPGRHSLLLSDKGLPLAIGDCESEACTGLQRYHSFSNKRTIYIRESILSLMLRLYSKLSESPDSYRSQPVPAESRSRIGNDLTFLQTLLDRIVATGPDRQATLQRVRERLWPREQDVNMSPPSDRMETIQDRRRRARDRQKKLIAEFASKQRAFMQKTMETEFKEEIQATSQEDPKKEYECVICSQMSSSEEDRPIGLVVLLQATSVLGHCHEIPDRKLPCDNDREHFNQGIDRMSLYADRTRFLTTYFTPVNSPLAFNIGWEGGVHVQSCGHYLHIDCHKSYIQSLTNQNQMSSRLQNLSVESGEYYCPLCRQLANSVLPLRPDLKGPSVQCTEKNLATLTLEVGNLLSAPLSDSDSNILKKYMGGIMDDMNNATLSQYRMIPPTYSPANSYLFVCSIARTNLELEMVQRKFLYELSKKSCFVSLLNVLSLHSILWLKTINETREVGYIQTMWRCLTEAYVEKSPYPQRHPFINHPPVYRDTVPLLVRDPITLFIQFILALPLNMDKAIFQSVVQMVWNLAYVQSLVSLSQKLDPSLRKCLAEEATFIDSYMGFDLHSILSKLGEGRTCLGYIIKNLLPKETDIETDMVQDVSSSYIEDYVQDYTTHFLKIASLLQSHLYQEDIILKKGDNEFQVLCSFLGLSSRSASSELSSASLLNWTTDPRVVMEVWFRTFNTCLDETQQEASVALHPQLSCQPPALLRLPFNYDAIFKHYHKKSCTICFKSPKDPSVCLVCGVMVCLREKCCREQYQYEAVKHSVKCGAGTAIYLAVNSSTIIVIRGKRACLWGSVYLDSYGEEDRDLKRGKPLYLSEDRYRLLQQQWISHSFDHTNKRWVWHKDNL